MQYGFLGRSGLRVSRLCLGTYNFGTRAGEDEAFGIMDAALESGINFFDTANHYPDFVNCGRTEEIIGRWFAQGGNRRERVVLATKVYQPMMDPNDGPNDTAGMSKFKIRRQCEGSLRRLRTDHIELYQMHHIDRRTPWAETWEGFERLIRDGTIDYVGSSNFPAWQLALAQAAAERRNLFGLVSEQHKYNLLCRLPELEVLPAALALGIGVLVYSPLAGGMLSGCASKAEPGSRSSSAVEGAGGARGKIAEFEKLCAEAGQPASGMALAWLFAQPAVSSVVIGPRTVAQLRASVAAADMAAPDREAIRRLDDIFPGAGHPAPEAYAW